MFLSKTQQQHESWKGANVRASHMCAAVPMLRSKDSLGRVEGAVCSETEEREDHSMCWKSLSFVDKL